MKIELASRRKLRERNKVRYRLAHWPIWIWVFFIAPGPLTFDLFEHGFDWRMGTWLSIVLIATGIAGLSGKLPGVEPKPYILRFTEDRPNPLYRRICYTFAWSAVAVFAILNLAGLVIAIVADKWYLRQIYLYGYFPLALAIWTAGALGRLPRVMSSTKGEGQAADSVKLAVFLGILALVGNLARRGLLPRTRPIVPGESAVSD